MQFFSAHLRSGAEVNHCFGIVHMGWNSQGGKSLRGQERHPLGTGGIALALRTKPLPGSRRVVELHVHHIEVLFAKELGSVVVGFAVGVAQKNLDGAIAEQAIYDRLLFAGLPK